MTCEIARKQRRKCRVYRKIHLRKNSTVSTPDSSRILLRQESHGTTNDLVASKEKSHDHGPCTEDPHCLQLPHWDRGRSERNKYTEGIPSCCVKVPILSETHLVLASLEQLFGRDTVQGGQEVMSHKKCLPPEYNLIFHCTSPSNGHVTARLAFSEADMDFLDTLPFRSMVRLSSVLMK